jgi:hypothetical protein
VASGRAAVDGLATDADLPHGCGVEVHPGKSRGVLLLKVATVDTTAEAKPYPIDNLTPLTFTGPLPVGMHRASVPASVNLLEDPMMIVGRRGSGKTVHLQVINAGLARCQDALIWHIDLNGAGMSSPWLSDFLAGQQDRPVIDWVAPTAAEAMLMVTTAVAIAKGRKVAYKQLMDSVNDDKLPISAQVPAIVLVLDEGAEAVAASRGNTDLAAALDELISIARAARVQEVFSGLRATSETIPTTLKKQVGVKVQMRPEDIDEIAQLFGWHSGVSVEDAPYPGSGLLKTPDSRGILPFRGYDLRPDAIRAIARDCRPLAADSRQALGGHRRDRLRQPLGPLRRLAHRPRRHHAHPENPRPVRERTHPAGGGIAGLGPAKADLDKNLAILRKLREEAENPKPQTEDVNAAFDAIVSGEQWGTEEAPASTDDKAHLAKVLTDAGPEGIHIDDIAARLAKVGVKPSRPTLYRWLDASAEKTGRAGWWRVSPE